MTHYQHTDSRPPLIRLIIHMRAERTRMILATIFSILNKIFDLAPPILIGAAVDIVVQRQDSVFARFGIVDVEQQLWALAAASVAAWVFESIFEYFEQVMWRNLAQSTQNSLRVESYDHVQQLELAYFEDHSTGGLMSILNDDVNQLERFLDVGADEIIQTVTTAIVIGGIFVVLAPSVAWMAIVPMPFVLFGSLWYQRFLAPRYAAVREEVGALNSQLSNNIGGIATIKSYTAEAYESRKMEMLSERYEARNRDAIRLSSAFTPLIRMIIVTGFVAIMVFGGKLALDGQLNVGAYSVLVFMTQRLLWPLTRLGNTLDLYQRAMASTARILDLLDTQTTIIDGRESLPLASVEGVVDFDDVTFQYADAGSPDVISDFTLHIPAGQTTAIVGATGSGKSTLIKLLLRFYDVTGGRILLDGHDIKTIKLDDLRRAIGFVSQDVYLFHGTVRENIAYGSFAAPLDDIVAAARIAEAHDFIMQLPNGYDTIVGERGQKLSGGQRQRISIARAVLKNPPILALDEATSAVDNETEAAIQRSLEQITQGRTTIIIAHRLSTIRNADHIVVLDKGRIVEQGTHDQLVASRTLYHRLWNVQTGLREERAA